MMNLSALLDGLAVTATEGGSPDVAMVRDDSRRVGPGDLYVAVAGQTVDGHDFLAEAARRGAVAAVVERPVPESLFPGARVLVPSTRRALAHLASRIHGDPARSMTMVGITGTNGKTTTTFLVEAILRAAGRRPGVIGTVNFRFGGEVHESSLTTPGALDLHAILARMRDAGCTHVVMETSSHALEQGRLDGIPYRVAAFTNLTQDHLDFHPDMEAYLAAKARLFRDLLADDGSAAVLVDGEYGRRMAAMARGRLLRLSLTAADADVCPLRASCTIDGIDALLSSPRGEIRLRSPLLGRFNLANLLVAAGTALCLDLPIAAIEEGLASVRGVPGRVEQVPCDRGFTIAVDYAHTPDALQNVLATLRPLTHGRLLCVFGCGGDRDRRKRPLMGEAVARDADLAIVTSDNPRTEEPGSIVDMILPGVRGQGLDLLSVEDLGRAPRGYHVEVDRRAAIRRAIAAAQQGDVVLIAGKGHEDYQIVGKTKHPFDDRLVAAEALRDLEARR